MRSSLPSTIDIEISIKTENDLVMADPTEVHQILMNLCANAGHAMKLKGGILTIKLIDHSGPILGWSESEALESGPFLRLSITDTGHGINPKLFPRIFEPFFTTKSQAEGTGMGLAVVHGIVKRYGGSISVESKINEGSTFYIYLPQLPAIKALRPSKEKNFKEPVGNNLRVLYIDDEVAIAQVAEESLRLMGFEAVSKSNSEEALKMFESNPNDFDAIITDQTMPGITGLELAKRVLQVRPSMPIFLCSGYNEKVTAKTAKNLGITDYLTKPLNFKELASLICAVCEEKTFSR
jgi:CheY-like chemotaxis protein